jgi:hypothetical protein
MTTAVQWSQTTQRLQRPKPCCLSSNYDNAFVTFKAPRPLVPFKAPPPPACKKVAEKVEHHNRSAKSGKKATAPSNNNGKAMAYA